MPSYGPPKLVESRGIGGFPPRAPQTLEQRKPQNRAPFPKDLGGESKGKEPRRVQAYIPQQISKRTPRNLSKNIAKKRLRKSPKRKTRKNSNKP
jgi:hypothetical protein